jgi:putative phage-type endonuclease
MTAVRVSPASDPEVRATGIGGSDLARILGMSRFGGPMEVWMEKRRLSAPLLESEPMRWGKLLEDPIAREYATKTGRRVINRPATIRVKGRPHLFAHIDRMSSLRGTPTRVLECKNANQFMVSDFGEPGSDQVPDDYLIQLQHYLGVTGYQTGDLAVLIGGQKHVVYTMERDDELLSEAWAEADRFWIENVEPGVPPPVDGSQAWREFATSRFESTGLEIPLTDTIETLAYEHKSLGEQAKALELRKQEVSTRLLNELGEASRATGKGVKVTHSVVHMPYPDYRAIFDVAKVTPAIVAEHTRVDVQHRLTITIKEA